MRTDKAKAPVSYRYKIFQAVSCFFGGLTMVMHPLEPSFLFSLWSRQESEDGFLTLQQSATSKTHCSSGRRLGVSWRGLPPCLWANLGVSCPGKPCSLSLGSRTGAVCGERAGMGMGLRMGRWWGQGWDWAGDGAEDGTGLGCSHTGLLLPTTEQQGDVCVADKARCQVRSGFMLSLSG